MERWQLLLRQIKTYRALLLKTNTHGRHSTKINRLNREIRRIEDNIKI